MFEIVAAGAVLDTVQDHDFDVSDDPMGAERIDAIIALDRAIRAAQAEQVKQIAALHESRSARAKIAREDPSLSVIGELGMARNISPSAAATQYGFAVALARLPRIASVFAAGGISEPAAKLIVKETTGLNLVQCATLDERLASRLSGLTARKAQQVARFCAISIDADAAYERAAANRLDRFVSLFGDRDGTAILQVRGPAEQLLAAYKTLDAAAVAAKAAGDPRTRGQVWGHRPGRSPWGI